MQTPLTDKRRIDALVTLAHLGTLDPPFDYWTGWSFTYVIDEPGTEPGYRAWSTQDGPVALDHMGQVLWDEAIRSANVRHGTKEPFGIYAYAPGRRLTVVEALKAIRIYQHATREVPGWQAREAHQLATALLYQVINEVPGYARAEPWASMD